MQANINHLPTGCVMTTENGLFDHKLTGINGRYLATLYRQHALESICAFFTFKGFAALVLLLRIMIDVGFNNYVFNMVSSCNKKSQKNNKKSYGVKTKLRGQPDT